MKKIKYIKSNDVEIKSGFDLIQITKGVLIASIISLCLLLLAAIMLTYTDVSLLSSKLISNIIFYVGALLSGLIAGYGLKFNGWSHGLISGGLYVCIILAINLLLNFNEIASSIPILKIILSCVLGCSGGVLGVNIPGRRAKKH